MPRPPQPRRVNRRAGLLGFKPIGQPFCRTPVLVLGLDGLEAVRLADLEGLYQEAAAEQMGVSRATFGRILTRARATLAEALVEGKALVIGEAAVIEVPGQPIPCPVHWGGRRRGRGCRCGGRWSDEGPPEEPTSATTDGPEGGIHGGGRRSGSTGSRTGEE